MFNIKEITIEHETGPFMRPTTLQLIFKMNESETTYQELYKEEEITEFPRLPNEDGEFELTAGPIWRTETKKEDFEALTYELYRAKDLPSHNVWDGSLVTITIDYGDDMKETFSVSCNFYPEEHEKIIKILKKILHLFKRPTFLERSYEDEDDEE